MVDGRWLAGYGMCKRRGEGSGSKSRRGVYVCVCAWDGVVVSRPQRRLVLVMWSRRELQGRQY